MGLSRIVKRHYGQDAHINRMFAVLHCRWFSAYCASLTPRRAYQRPNGLAVAAAHDQNAHGRSIWK